LLRREEGRGEERGERGLRRGEEREERKERKEMEEMEERKEEGGKDTYFFYPHHQAVG
jgi:hypothetical protein